MINTFFIGDTHFGHKNIMKFEPVHRPFKSVEEHDEVLIERWNSVVKSNDIVWHLGDVAFGQENLDKIGRCNGKKKLVMGNHDTFQIERYAKYFTHVYGAVVYKKFLLTHIPIVSTQFYRCKGNIHGHTHSNNMDDPRYINVSCEQNNLTPINYEDLTDIFYNKMLNCESPDAKTTLRDY